jgi:Rho-binding antiterminator
MATDYQSIDCGFYDELEAAATQRRHVLLQYFSDLHELRVESVVVRGLETREHAEYAQLSNGEEVRLDRIMRLDEKIAPQYKEYPDFSCGC